MRLDQFLVKSKMVSSRTQAQDFIANGFVHLALTGGHIKILDKASFEVDESNQSHIRVQANELQKYVSRAGLKLEHALDFLNLEVKAWDVLDVGQSTGGFTDCLLQRGARRAVGIDVGHNQLHARIRDHKDVSFIEGLNVKDLGQSEEFIRLVPKGGFDLIVADVSFISLTKVVPYLGAYLRRGGKYIFLVKPQFECGAEHLDKNGVVKNKSVYIEVQKNVEAAVGKYFLIGSYFASGIAGKDGNQEFFIYGENSN